MGTSLVAFLALGCGAGGPETAGGVDGEGDVATSEDELNTRPQNDIGLDRDAPNDPALARLVRKRKVHGRLSGGADWLDCFRFENVAGQTAKVRLFLPAGFWGGIILGSFEPMGPAPANGRGGVGMSGWPRLAKPETVELTEYFSPGREILCIGTCDGSSTATGNGDGPTSVTCSGKGVPLRYKIELPDAP